VKRSRINPVSAKRRATFEARRECVEIVLERDKVCQWNVRCAALGRDPLHACWGPLDVHEPGHRSQGADPTDPEQCVAVCRGCHSFLHAHPLLAKELGL